MTDDRWATIDRLLGAALERPPHERAAFLREACRDDEPLRREVETLVGHDARAAGFMSVPAAGRPVHDSATSGMIGRHIGPYVVLATLGAGGMGEVYRARDTRLGREVAIKILPHALSASPERRARFEREARLLATLNHPHIGAIYGVEDFDGGRALVLELVEGETLAERIAAAPLAIDDALATAGQIADALNAAHERGIVHRDLKPANIKITPNGSVKVLDFGLAKAASGDASDTGLTQAATATGHGTREGAILGTAAYISPEQARGAPVNKRADIWAFGVVLYEMLTGTPLYARESLSDTLAAVLKDMPDLSRVPLPVRRLLRSCLQKDPKQRLHDIGDWKLLLEDPSAVVPGQVPSRTSWLWPSMAAFAALGWLATGAWEVMQTSPPPRPDYVDFIKPAELGFNEGTQAAISPDGRYFAFAAVGADGKNRMYVRAFDSSEVLPLPGSEGIADRSPPPYWSYDSRFIVYGADGTLKKSEVTGIPAQPIAQTRQLFLQGVTWSKDNVILYARRGGILEQVSASGGIPTEVTMLAAGETAHRYPQFLRDGRRFLYLRVGLSPQHTGIYVGSLDIAAGAQSMKRILATDRQAWWVTSEHSGRTYLVMQRQDKLFAQPFDVDTATLSGQETVIASGVGAFPAATSGMWSVACHGDLVYRAAPTQLPQLTWVGFNGQPVIGAAVGDIGHNTDPAVSPNGDQVVFTRTTAAGSDIRVQHLASGGTSGVTSDARLELSPIWFGTRRSSTPRTAMDAWICSRKTRLVKARKHFCMNRTRRRSRTMSHQIAASSSSRPSTRKRTTICWCLIYTRKSR